MSGEEMSLEMRFYRHLCEAGSVVFLPMTRCPECAGSGMREKNVRCPNCFYSSLPGWLPVKDAEKFISVLATRGRYGPGQENVSNRSGNRGAGVPARGRVS